MEARLVSNLPNNRLVICCSQTLDMETANSCVLFEFSLMEGDLVMADQRPSVKLTRLPPWIFLFCHHLPPWLVGYDKEARTNTSMSGNWLSWLYEHGVHWLPLECFF